jgi:prophage regulatory protein
MFLDLSRRAIMAAKVKRRIQRYLRRKEVQTRTGFSRSTIYQRIREGTFPAPRRLGPSGTRAVGWADIDVDDFMDDPVNWRAPSKEDEE